MNTKRLFPDLGARPRSARIVVASLVVSGLLIGGCSTTTDQPADNPLPAPGVFADGNANDVTLSWTMSSPEGGPKATAVAIETTDGASEVELSGSKTEGDGRNQERCIRARAKDADGNWGPWSEEKCAKTWEPWKATQIVGEDAECAEGMSPAPCHKVMVKIERANPNSPGTCKLDSTFGYDETVDFTVDAEGTAFA